jgi:2-keto-4-pentenoate hydratase/2-oxohepta-3-ene-1,7-dioic acid hydratase in catechol pathway
MDAGPKGGWPLADTHLRAPLLWPSAIYCAGANYRDHAAEMAERLGRPKDPDPKASGGQPWHFLKAPRSIADPGASIEATGYSKKLDWEVELAAVIGRPAAFSLARATPTSPSRLSLALTFLLPRSKLPLALRC